MKTKFYVILILNLLHFWNALFSSWVILNWVYCILCKKRKFVSYLIKLVFHLWYLFSSSFDLYKWSLAVKCYCSFKWKYGCSWNRQIPFLPPSWGPRGQPATLSGLLSLLHVHTTSVSSSHSQPTCYISLADPSVIYDYTSCKLKVIISKYLKLHLCPVFTL